MWNTQDCKKCPVVFCRALGANETGLASSQHAGQNDPQRDNQLCSKNGKVSCVVVCTHKSSKSSPLLTVDKMSCVLQPGLPLLTNCRSSEVTSRATMQPKTRAVFQLCPNHHQCLVVGKEWKTFQVHAPHHDQKCPICVHMGFTRLWNHS